MPKTAKTKTKKHRYVVEVLVETNVKVTKKAVRECVENALVGFAINYPWDTWVDQKSRVRKVDMD